MKHTNYLLIIICAVVLLVSCSKNDPAPTPPQAVVFNNLSADPPSGGYDPNNGQPIGVTNKFTFFSFATGTLINHADSATVKWDLGFRGTTIIVNGGTSGPGTAAVQVVAGIFAEQTTAPETGYKQDDNTSGTAPHAIPTGSGNGWYNYDFATNIVTPIAGRVIVVKCANGKYAKMEILSYYKDKPATITATDPDRYYSFRFLYQPDGSKKFQ